MEKKKKYPLHIKHHGKTLAKNKLKELKMTKLLLILNLFFKFYKIKFGSSPSLAPLLPIISTALHLRFLSETKTGKSPIKSFRNKE